MLSSLCWQPQVGLHGGFCGNDGMVSGWVRLAFRYTTIGVSADGCWCMAHVRDDNDDLRLDQCQLWLYADDRHDVWCLLCGDDDDDGATGLLLPYYWPCCWPLITLACGTDALQRIGPLCKWACVCVCASALIRYTGCGMHVLGIVT